MEWILWRHAQAQSGNNDLERPLSAFGEAQADCAADWLNHRLPDKVRILVSPARRAQQTAAALKRDYTTVNDLAPTASVQTVLAAVPPDDGVTLIVGHQPALSEIAIKLLDDDFDALKWHPAPGSLFWMEWVEDAKGTPRAKLKTIYSP